MVENICYACENVVSAYYFVEGGINDIKDSL